MRAIRWAIIGLISGAIGCSAPPPTAPDLPVAGDVESVTATVFGSVSEQLDLAEFDIPCDFVPDILRLLTPCEYHPRPLVSRSEVVARLLIRRVDGRTSEVLVLFARGETVQFTIQGVPCRRAGTYHDFDPASGVDLPEVLRIEALLRDLHRGDSRRARNQIERMDRAAGR